ncbi:MAG: hypothetical protein ACE5KY_04030 [Candidatus Tectimicrobiota bacterium]
MIVPLTEHDIREAIEPGQKFPHNELVERWFVPDRPIRLLTPYFRVAAYAASQQMRGADVDPERVADLARTETVEILGFVYSATRDLLASWSLTLRQRDKPVQPVSVESRCVFEVDEVAEASGAPLRYRGWLAATFHLEALDLNGPVLLTLSGDGPRRTDRINLGYFK